jgi:hypothetical protein
MADNKVEKKELVKVKILHPIGRYEFGKEYDVSEDEAEKICNVRVRHDGTNAVKYQCAVPLKALEALKKKKIEDGGLTQCELEELGMKHVVKTPVNKEFEARLAAIREGKPMISESIYEEGRAQAKASTEKKMKAAKEQVLGDGKESA